MILCCDGKHFFSYSKVKNTKHMQNLRSLQAIYKQRKRNFDFTTIHNSVSKGEKEQEKQKK